jgi:hypothetical protein
MIPFVADLRFVIHHLPDFCQAVATAKPRGDCPGDVVTAPIGYDQIDPLFFGQLIEFGELIDHGPD